MTRIILADDHDMVRRGVRDVLEAREGWYVCGEASNGRDAVNLVKRVAPDIAILDISMPGLNGVDATRLIRRECPATEVIIFTLHEEEQIIREALFAGARGIVSKADGGTQIVLAVETLARRKPFFSPVAARMILDEFGSAERSLKHGSVRTGRLTSREADVTRLLAQGLGNREIGTMLGLSVKTVETHRAAIMRKVHVHSLVDLVRYAIRNGLVEA